METTNLTFEQASEFVQNRANELKKLHGVEIIPMLFDHNGSWVYGWLKSPHRLTIMEVLGKMGERPLFTGETVLRANLLPESDPKILNESAEFDSIFTSACLAAYASCNKLSANLVQKKTGK